MSMLEKFFTYEVLYLVIFSLAIGVAIFIVRKLVNRSLITFSEKTGLEKHVQNILRMVSNIAIYALGVTVLLQSPDRGRRRLCIDTDLGQLLSRPLHHDN